MKHLSAPVIVDDTRQFDDIEVARCTCFHIENDEPLLGWENVFLNDDSPLKGALHNGILMHPVSGHTIFNTPESIEKIFELVERNGGAHVAPTDIWIPAEFLPGVDKVKRGMVFRIPLTLLQLLFKFRTETLSLEELRQASIPFLKSVKHSAEEESAFSQWNRNLIEKIKNDYHGNKESQLRHFDKKR